MIIKVDILIPYRLDKYLKSLYPGLTQGLIEKALRKKDITVNKLKTESNTRLQYKDEIYISDKFYLPTKKVSETVFSTNTKILANKILGEYLIFENEYFIAISKPAGLATQGGSKINLSIDDALKYLNSQGGEYKLVHRLDKETSGIFLIAKNYESSVKLTHAFHERLITKTYLAVVYGVPEHNHGEIRTMIAKKEGNFQIVDIDNENGKLAITKYELLKLFDNNLSLIKFMPITGRMHQLRFHAKFLNCPIVGDTKYGNNSSSSISKYMLLHASDITLSKKIFGTELTLAAKLPGYFFNISLNL